MKLLASLAHETFASGEPSQIGLALVHGSETGLPRTELARSIAAAATRPLDRRALADALRRHCGALGAGPLVHDALDRLRIDGTVVVVAGQQPGPGGGAHLAVSKALAAAALARRITESGTPAVAMYWSASEDHDHEEANSVLALRRGGPHGAPEILDVSLALPKDRRMLSRTPLGAAGVRSLAEFADWLPDGPGTSFVRGILRSDPNESVGTHAARVMQELLSPLGVIVAEPATLRASAAGLVLYENDHPGALAAAVRESEARLVAAGFAPPLGVRDGPLHFRADREGRRHRAPARTEPSELAERPECVSWNAAGRVLAQDLALPVAAQVCGLAEAGYVHATAPAHALLGVTVPAIVARPGVTLLPAGASSGTSDVQAAALTGAGAAGAWARPRGALQERVASILPFVAACGPAILGEIAAAFRDGAAEHLVFGYGDER